MNVERALETQRVKLLRLLTGWFAVVVLLSAGPLALPLPVWFRSFLAGVLTRAEFAAQCLVRVSVCLQAHGGGCGAYDVPRSDFALGSDEELRDALPSSEVLIRRMNALRDLLENLPRHARRLLSVQTVVGEAFDFRAPPRAFLSRDRLTTAGADWIGPRVDRPPDKMVEQSILCCSNSHPRTRSEGPVRLSNFHWMLGTSPTMTSPYQACRMTFANASLYTTLVRYSDFRAMRSQGLKADCCVL